MQEVVKFGFGNKELMKLSNNIRKVVFIEEQLVDPKIEYEYEEEGNYYLLYVDNVPVATARWRLTDGGIKLERFATLSKYRNLGLGSLLLKEMLMDITPLGKRIYLHSQVNAKRYYERAGFKSAGDHFFEAEIEHVLMEYEQDTKLAD